MKILDVDKYRDGGTISIHTDEGTFCYDNRIGSETRHCMFIDYPKADNSNIMNSELSRELTFKIINQLSFYKE